MEEDKVISDCHLLVIGGSAGSLEVLMQVLPLLNTIPSFAIVIILHRKSAEDTTLEDLIALKTIIPVKEVEDKVALVPGFIYIAPSDYHLLFEKNEILSLDVSEKINHSRPSIDVSFESASEIYGPNLVGLLLSGANSDGTSGLIAIKKAGGTIIIQNPDTAKMSFMPNNAMQHTTPDFIVDTDNLAAFIGTINL